MSAQSETIALHIAALPECVKGSHRNADDGSCVDCSAELIEAGLRQREKDTRELILALISSAADLLTALDNPGPRLAGYIEGLRAVDKSIKLTPALS